MRSLRDKVVVITGGAGGIGSSMARDFASHGARIALLDLDPLALEAVAAPLRSEGVAIITAVCDICEPQACARAMDQVIEAFGGIDVLVNNAGTSHRSLFTQTDTSVLRKVMEVNFFGAVNCTQAALASITQRRGKIVAMSSVAGFAPLVGRSGYCASKHALHGFFDTLRNELRSTGVSVLMVCPSFVATALRNNAVDGHGNAMNGRAKDVGHLMQPEEVAAKVVAAVLDDRRMALVSIVSRATWWLSRVAPPVYDRIMMRRQAGEFEPR